MPTRVGADEVVCDNTCWSWMVVGSGWAGIGGWVVRVDEEKGRRREEENSSYNRLSPV